MSTLSLASDTLATTPAAGSIEYNGQFFGTDSTAARGQFERITLNTATVTTSGTAIDITGQIPAWAKKVTLLYNGVSTSAATNMLIQLGTSSGVETSGYASGGSTTGNNPVTSTAGFVISITTAAAIVSGAVTLYSYGSNTWICSGLLTRTDAGSGLTVGGTKTLSGTLDRIRLTVVTPASDSYDAGAVNILVEG